MTQARVAYWTIIHTTSGTVGCMMIGYISIFYFIFGVVRYVHAESVQYKNHNMVNHLVIICTEYV